MTQPQDRTKTSASDVTLELGQPEPRQAEVSSLRPRTSSAHQSSETAGERASSAFCGYTHVHYTDVTFDLLDPGNVVYHPNYLVLSDRARASAFDDLGYGLRDLWAQGYALAVRELSTEFLRPVLAGAQLAILSQLAISSSRSIRVQQRFVVRPDVLKAQRIDGFVEPSELLQSELVLNQMEAKLVCVDLRKQRAAHLPASLVSAIQRLEQAPDPTCSDLTVRRSVTSRWSDLRAWVRETPHSLARELKNRKLKIAGRSR